MFCRRNVILDLDETCISAVNYKDLPSSEETRKDLFEAFSSTKISFVNKNHTFKYQVFERPDLQKFLTWLFRFFNVGVLTYGRDPYAIEIVKNIILKNHPERHLVFYLSYNYEDHKNAYKHSETKELTYPGRKNLRYLFERIRPFNFYPCNTILMDDQEDIRDVNFHNCISVPKFEVLQRKNDEAKVNFGAKYDTVLLQVALELILSVEMSNEWECKASTRYSSCKDNNAFVLDQPIIIEIPDKEMGFRFPDLLR
jgi:hypothetical protein